ncbi:MAG: mechanosensitive ion channel family protein [Halobacteriales archaeon]|nr:mechanosensitive ion channel family protein [Halobacteriales archaeon]
MIAVVSEIGQLVPSLPPEQRFAVSAGLLIALAVVTWGLRRVRGRAHRFGHERLVDVILGVILLGSVLAGGGLLVVLWDASAYVTESVQFLRNPLAAGAKILASLALLAGVYIASGALDEFVEDFLKNQSGISEHQAEITFRTVQVLAYAIAIIIILGLWDVNLGGLLVGAGFLGIVLGMAARQTLGSLIAGFVIMFSRPFEIGDWVQIGDKEGIVTDITVVNTRIQNFDGEYVMLPNDTVSSSDIINRTRKGRLRIQLEVGVDYDTDLEEAGSLAKNAMDEVDDILTVPQPQVVFKRFGDSAIVLGLRFWIDKPSARRRWRAQTAVIKAVKQTFDANGIKIPFPQRELMGRTEEGGFRLQESGHEPQTAAPDGSGDPGQ